MFLKLPPEKLQPLCDCMEKQRALKEDIVKTFEPLRDLLEKSIKSAEKAARQI